MARHREPSETARSSLRAFCSEKQGFHLGSPRARGRSACPTAAACRYVPTFSLAGFLFGKKQPGLNTRDRIVPGAWSKLEEDFREHPRVHRQLSSFSTSKSRAIPAKNCGSQRVECILAKWTYCTNRTELRGSSDEFGSGCRHEFVFLREPEKNSLDNLPALPLGTT